MFISIVMPVRNEGRYIGSTLSQLLSQDYDPAKFEILVVDGESDDDTCEVVRQIAADRGQSLTTENSAATGPCGRGSGEQLTALLPVVTLSRDDAPRSRVATSRAPQIRLLSNPKRLSSAARNVGVRHARGDVVLIVDGHCEIPNDQLLRNLAEAFRASGADCVGRPQPLDVTGANPLQCAIAAARASRLGHHPDSFIYSSEPRFVPAKSVAVAYRREIFERLGYFDEAFDACEDCEFNHRCDQAGLRCYFTPQVAVRYEPRSTLGGLFRQLVRYGRGRVRMLRKHPDTASLGSFLPAAFVLGVVIGFPLHWLAPWLAAVYLGTLATYLSVVLVTAATAAVRSGRTGVLPWLPMVLVTIHLGSALGVLWEAGHRHRLSG